MEYLSVAEIAKKWNTSERSVRNYCAQNRVKGAILTGKTWYIPENAIKPDRVYRKKFSDNALLNVLKEEKDMRLKGGIYHKTQIALTYNSNHIEGSTLTEEQTRFIFETNTIGETYGVKVDDIIETNNHFKCVDMVIDEAKKVLTEKFIKKLHFTLKTGTGDSLKPWFNVGNYKQRPNELGEGASIIKTFASPNEKTSFIKKFDTSIGDYSSNLESGYLYLNSGTFPKPSPGVRLYADGSDFGKNLSILTTPVGNATCPPEKVAEEMKKLIDKYNGKAVKSLEDVVEFHKDFESIHPFQDGNGRVGRLIMFKECLANNIVPFIIEDELKFYYYRGLREWDNERGFLIGTCLTAQDKYKKYMEYFDIALPISQN